MTGAIRKHLRKQQLKSGGSGGSVGSPSQSPSSSSAADDSSSPPAHLYQRSKTASWEESGSGTTTTTLVEGGSTVKSRRGMGQDRGSSFSGDQESDLMELRKELAEKEEELSYSLGQCKHLQIELEREREGRREEEGKRQQLSAQMKKLQEELHHKALLLDEHEAFVYKLQSGEDVDHAIEELLVACEGVERSPLPRDQRATNGAHHSGSDTPRSSRLAAAEKENKLYEQEVARLREQVEYSNSEKGSLQQEVDRLRAELESVRNQGDKKQAANGFADGGEELKAEIESLRRELEDVREDKEATVTELLSQVMALNSKLQSAKKEREAAVVAAERKMDVMKRELATVIERNEKNEADIEKARVSIMKAEEYLKALDVARVEVKRLRLERDLLMDKLRHAEEVMRKKGVTGVDMTSWLMPNCLLQRDAEDPKFIPDTPAR